MDDGSNARKAMIQTNFTGETKAGANDAVRHIAFMSNCKIFALRRGCHIVELLLTTVHVSNVMGYRVPDVLWPVS